MEHLPQDIPWILDIIAKSVSGDDERDRESSARGL
jgi:hypothetical protein